MADHLADTSDPLFGLGGSAYLQRAHGIKSGTPPWCDLEKEKNLHLVLRALIQSGLVKSAHDCSEGGLAVTVAESCISHQMGRETPRLLGAQIDLTEPADDRSPEDSDKREPSAGSPTSSAQTAATLRTDALLFGESQGRIVISTASLDAVKVVERAKLLGVPAMRIGTVGGDQLAIKAAKTEFSCGLVELHDLWWNSIARAMKD